MGGSGGREGTPRIARRRRPGRTVRRVLVGGLLVALAVLGGAFAAVWSAREQAFAQAAREVENLSYLLADHTERGLQAADMAMGAVLERARAEGALENAAAFRHWAESLATHSALRARADALPHVDALFLTDQAGLLVASSRFHPSPQLDLSIRRFFQDIRAGMEETIGPPVRISTGNSWAFHYAKRIEGADGSTLGVIAAALDPLFYGQLYGALALGAESSVALFRSDGVLLARHPHTDGMIGRSFADLPRFVAEPRDQDSTTLRTPGLEGRDRLVSMRGLAALPMEVHVGFDMAELLRDWRTLALRFAAGALVVLLLIAAAMILALRAARAEMRASAQQLAHERAAAGQRVRYQAELAARHADFRLTVEGMSQGVCMFDEQGRIGLANQACARLLGLSEEALRPGQPLDGIMQAASGAGRAGTVRLLQHLHLLSRQRRGAGFVEDLAPGRAVSVLYQPLPTGGWVATFEDVSERRAAEERIRHLAENDPLTGLPNRAQLHARLDRMIAGAGADGEGQGRIAILYLDLDRFKQVNDTLGHAAGDALLQAAADRLSASVRASRPGGDLVARLGGDEFVVALRLSGSPLQDGRQEATAVAQRIISSLSEPYLLDAQQAIIGATVGIAFFPEDGRTAVELLRAGDLALYAAKREGRGRHRTFMPELSRAAQKRRAIEVALRRTLFDGAGHGIELFFQPVMDLRSGTVSGCEALVRWRTGDGRLASPAEFIPVAEETGLIIPLGAAVLHRACAAAAAWEDAGTRIAVNLSPVQFRSADLVATVEAALGASGLDPGRLELEVTEGVLLQQSAETLGIMQRLRRIGIGFAMDDFGTGYSSLAQLRAFPFGRVKLDRSFVQDIERRPGDMAIVRAVARLCSELEMVPLAEGVETAGQLRALVEAGCQEAQGFLFSRPVPGGEIEAVLDALAERRPGSAAAPAREYTA